MKSNISEFSYGYALTENIVTNPALKITAAPVFPSLISEGQPGGGYDVSISSGGLLLFLQFKLSDCLIRYNANEAYKLGLPYYRFHIRSIENSDQHPMLLDLENLGELVFYTAPKFHIPFELNDAYLTKEVVQRSIFVKPSIIGPIADKEEHYVAFNAKEKLFVCSQPREVDSGSIGHDYFLNEVSRNIRETDRNILDSQYLHDLVENMVNIVRRSKQKGFWNEIDPGLLYSNRPPLEQVSYISRIFFGCELLIARFLI